jgi:uncharacterized protein involved in exopolysaccharide biosynthesis
MEKKEVSLKELIFEIKNIFNFLINRWKLIVITAGLGATVGLCISIFSKPNYVSSLKFVIDEEKKGGGLASIASSFGLGGVAGGTSLFSSPNIIEFLKTRSMVEKTLLRPVSEKKYNNTAYANLYIRESGLYEKWNSIPELKNISFSVGENREKFSRVKDSLLGVVYGRFLDGELTVTQPNEDNSIIVINVSTKSEVFSKNFPTELINLASTYYTETKTKKAKSSVDVLQKQVDSIRTELYSSMGSAASASDQIFGLNPTMNVQRVPSAKQQTEVKVNGVILEELVKNLEISKMNLLNETPIINIIDEPIYPLTIERIRKIKGILIGGIISGFLIIVFLLVRRFFKNLGV